MAAPCPAMWKLDHSSGIRSVATSRGPARRRRSSCPAGHTGRSNRAGRCGTRSSTAPHTHRRSIQRRKCRTARTAVPRAAHMVRPHGRHKRKAPSHTWCTDPQPALLPELRSSDKHRALLRPPARNRPVRNTLDRRAIRARTVRTRSCGWHNNHSIARPSQQSWPEKARVVSSEYLPRSIGASCRATLC